MSGIIRSGILTDATCKAKIRMVMAKPEAEQNVEQAPEEEEEEDPIDSEDDYRPEILDKDEFIEELDIDIHVGDKN